MRTIKYLLLSILLVSVIESCGPGIQDFETSLTDNYVLNRSSSTDINISPKNGWRNEDETIPSKVVKVNVYKNYILAERLKIENLDLENQTHCYKIFPKDQYDYWIIDFDKKQIFKKLKYSQFLAKADSLKIPRSVKLIDIYDY